MVIEALDGAHPRQLLDEGRGDEFALRMAEALTTFAAGFAPRPVTYRTIDFRTNEFRGLRGGERFEPEEANPMIGYRGVLRYVREPDLFGLELAAIRRVWDAGHANLHVMLPFVRTADELLASFPGAGEPDFVVLVTARGGGVDDQQGALAGGEAARNLVGEVDVAGSVDQVQGVGVPVLGLVADRHRMGLNRDPSLPFQIHGIQNLVLGLPGRDGASGFEEPVSEG